MAVGGMLGAYSGSAWLARVRDSALHRAVRWLLLGIGALLLVEALTPWASTGLPMTGVSRTLLALVCGTGIGVVSSLLGVARGELIIPTLLFLFGIDVKTAGTLSLLISVPTVTVGLWRQRAGGSVRRAPWARWWSRWRWGRSSGHSLGRFSWRSRRRRSSKALLGLTLVASPLRIFAPREHYTAFRKPPVR